MARSQKTPEHGSAGRLAAGRRPRARDVVEKAPKASAPSARGKGKKGKPPSSSPAARLFKLVSLLVLMAVLGFAVVLVVDVGVTLIGNVRFGQATFSELFGKVADRVFDRDVPQPRPAKKIPAKTTTTTTARAPVPPAARAPVAAPRPEDYARHVQEPVEPEVQAAKARLDQLLNRL
ncbi:MAG: hypothetical protein Q8O67_14255 [Deltaproteobacteria bacterium]|nr:hypothetical protein [Deltaproteobacteria bacterium]